ncbi:MAG TPA: Crp/Fnr family transcriptional regulator [Terracidiphilus sp.]|nr:Crp/Fnr family transcriptional regulator [Terracidiphilus sp.]
MAELLACPPATASVLNAAACSIEFECGQIIFRQGSESRGLYLVVAGTLVRKAERRTTRLILGTVRAGELVELAAALGDGQHTCTLTAQSSGSLMLLPSEALRQAFRAYPPLRMQLLGELAREVSRAYAACRKARVTSFRADDRRRSTG